MNAPTRRVAARACLVALAATVYTTGPLYRVRSWWSYEDPLADDVAVVAVYALVGVGGIGLLATGDRWRAVPVPLRVSAAALVAWYVLSAVWSVDPARTLRESLFIGVTLAAGAGAAAALGARAVAWASWAGIHLGLGWSFVAIAVGANGTLDGGGNEVGVYFNRNSLGLYAVLGLVVGAIVTADALARARVARRSSAWWIAAIGLAAVAADGRLILGANATTPMIAGAAALAAVALAVVARGAIGRGWWSARAVVAGAGAVAALVSVVAWLWRTAWAEGLGRSSDFTGRVDIWEVSLDYAAERPFVGHGYLGPWSDEAFVREVDRVSGYTVGSAHNSFVEAMLGTGAIGLVAFVAFVAVVYTPVARAAITAHGPLALLPLALFTFVVVENLAETLFVGNQLTVALLSAAAVVATRAPASPTTGADDPAGAGQVSSG